MHIIIVKELANIHVTFTCYFLYNSKCFFVCYYRICNIDNTTDVSSGANTAYNSRAPEFAPIFSVVNIVNFLI